MKPNQISIITVSILTATALAQSYGVWEPETTLPTNGQAKTHAIGVEDAGTLYVLGGPPWVIPDDMEDGTVYSSPIGGSAWSEEIGFDGYGGVIGQGGGLDDLGRIIIFGGDDPNNPGFDKPPFEWNPIEGPWRDHADRGANAPATNFAYCSDELNRIYSIGGGAGTGASAGNPNSAYGERYIGSQERWEPIAPMPFGLANAAACPDGLGHILVFGGISADGSSRLNEVLQYDISSDSWSSTANSDMPAAVSNHRASMGADGRIYILGGIEGPLNAPTTVSSVRVYDPMNDSWSDGPPMSEARRNFTSILGSDNRLYVMGGENDSGGTASVESIYTTPCPVIFEQPSDLDIWRGMTLSLQTQTAGGGTITYQWMRDDVALSDGEQPDGSVVSGVQTQQLTIEGMSAQAGGTYTLTASNSCGSTTSSPAMIAVRIPPEIPQHWTWTSLHPPYAESSFANGVDNGVQVGRAVFDTPDYNNIDHPMRWGGTAASGVNLTPGSSQGGNILDFAGDKLVGWWWEPIQCYVNHQWQTCYYRRACWWNLDGTFHSTSYSGYEYTLMSATDGVTVVGSGATDDDVGNVFNRAVIWQAPTHEFAFSIHPSGFPDSAANAVDGEYQYGNVSLPFQGLHAAKWQGSATSFVDMHPAGAINSDIVDASDGQQAGLINRWNNPHAVLWAGSPESMVDLNPEGATQSSITACEMGLQIGSATFPDEPTAQIGIWASSPGSFTSLVDVVPAGYLGFSMNAIDVTPDGSISIVGSSYNTDLQRTEAILLTSSAQVPCIADLNDDGVLNFFDVSAFLAAFSGQMPQADFTGDGQYNFFDVSAFLAAYSAGCP